MRPTASLLVFFFAVTAASAQTLDDRFWIPNDRVFSAAVVDQTLFVGGDFTVVGPPTGFGAAIDADSGDVALGWARINGVIYAAEPDGAGGFFVGGAFETIDGAPRHNLVHLLADGSVDSAWGAEANGRVRALTRLGDTLYVGGEFTRIGDTTRRGVAALDADGVLTPFDPGVINDEPYVIGEVREILALPDRVYAAGIFSRIGGAPRANLAALDPATGDALAFDAQVASGVDAIVLEGDTLYLGGYFSSVAGAPRGRLAAVDATSGALLPWAPESNGYVKGLAVVVGAVYAGGIFSQINGQTRFGVAAIHPASGALLPFNADLDVNSVSDLTVTGDRLWIVGGFRELAGVTRRYIAAVDPATGAALPWRSDAGNRVHALAVDGDRLYAGGIATTYGAVERKSLAAFDLATGQLLDLDPGEIGRVRVLEPSDRGTLFIGGAFTEIGGAPRRYLAELDPVTANVTDWSPPELYPPIFGGLAFDADRVFVGGEFVGTQDGVSRHFLAALDKAEGDLEPWNPTADLWVRDVVYHDGLVYAGGHFHQIDGVPRRGLAAIDAGSGGVDAFPFEIGPPTGGHIDDLLVTGDVLYAVGLFDGFAGKPRRGGAAIDLASETLLPWNPDAWPIRSVSVANGVAYIGGAFSSVGGTPKVFAAAVDAQTGALLDWDPAPIGFIEGGASASGEPDVMLAHAGVVVMGGDFLDSMAGSGHAYLVVVVQSLFADGFESSDTSAWSSSVP